jgi:hypothetical protein
MLERFFKFFSASLGAGALCGQPNHTYYRDQTLGYLAYKHLAAYPLQRYGEVILAVISPNFHVQKINCGTYYTFS